MKTGALSKEEKLNIINSLQQSKSVDDIAKDLDRSEELIQKYLEEIRTAVEEKPEAIVGEVNPKILERVSHQLTQLGLSKVSINNKINRILKVLSPEQIKNITAEALISDCMAMINAHDVMINKTGSGNSGVAIMSEAGSERGDKAVSQAPKQSPHTYKIY